MNPRIPLALALALVTAACTKDGVSPADEEAGWRSEPAAEASDFKLSVTPASSVVELGDDVVLKVKVVNEGEVKVRANVPRLGRDSVTFRVRSAAFDVASLDPIPVKEGPRGAGPNPPEVREIGKGESVEGEIRFAAVLVGRLTLSPVYACQALPGPLAGEPFSIEVTPSPKGSHVGLRMETSHGTVDAKLRPEIAFQTCTMFATLVKKGFYDGLRFHRVIAGFMAQGGDPQGQGWGGPGYQLRRELHGKLPHRRGVFAMARQNIPDTAGSQFYVMFRDDPNLDRAGYTTFAEMTSGEDALKRMESVGGDGSPGHEAPREPITVTKMTLVVLP